MSANERKVLMTSRKRRRRRCPEDPGPETEVHQKADLLDGLCDYIAPGGAWCSHWRAPDSGACFCHRDVHNGRLDPV